MGQVTDILNMIDRLSPAEREELEARLAERLESEWRSEADLAREDARRRGLDQDAIDRNIDEDRYGA